MKRNYGHHLLKKEEIEKIRKHIDDLSYIQVEKIYPKLYDKVIKKEINKTEFRLLCIYWFE